MNMNAAYKVESHLDVQQTRWFAVYTRYKREKLVLDRLLKKGLEAYLPLQKHTRRYTRKTRVVELPLISCYIFVCITSREYISVLETEDILGFVNFSGNLISIPEEEIEIMKRVVGENIPVSTEPNQFQVGDPVEIMMGNVTVIRGILLKQKRSDNFLVELNRTGYSLCMEIDAELLRPAPEPGTGGEHTWRSTGKGSEFSRSEGLSPA